MDEAALRPSESELAKFPASVQQIEPPKMRKRGPKGPNPLSVKKKKPAVPQPAQPRPKSNSISIGSKRELDDEQDAVQPSAETDQAPGSGHKRKRRRKTKSEPSADRDAS
jgi:U3 small nucleolar RNA-associated protein 23